MFEPMRLIVFQLQKKDQTKVQAPKIRFQGNYTPVAMTIEKNSHFKREHLNVQIQSSLNDLNNVIYNTKVVLKNACSLLQPSYRHKWTD